MREDVALVGVAVALLMIELGKHRTVHWVDVNWRRPRQSDAILFVDVLRVGCGKQRIVEMIKDPRWSGCVASIAHHARSRRNSQRHEIDLTAENASTQCRCDKQTSGGIGVARSHGNEPKCSPRHGNMKKNREHLSGIRGSNKRAVFLDSKNLHHRCQLNSHFGS